MSWIVVGIVVAVALYVVSAYNGFVRLTQRTKEAWADIDVQLKRRYDLIPNLIETVKGYAAHERGVFEEVTNARAKATQVHVDPSNITAEQITAMAGAESALGASLGKLLAVAEAYPDLKANQNFLDLQSQLEGTENRINVARQRYNESVQGYNTYVRGFFRRMALSIFGGGEDFSVRKGFEAQQGADTAPVVKFQ